VVIVGPGRRHGDREEVVEQYGDGDDDDDDGDGDDDDDDGYDSRGGNDRKRRSTLTLPR
jgi:hypothetical protein